MHYRCGKTKQTAVVWPFGHVERKDSNDWVSACRHFEVNEVRIRGRGRKTLDECVKKDLVEFGLHREWALDRVRWRGLMCRKRSTRPIKDNRR